MQVVGDSVGNSVEDSGLGAFGLENERSNIDNSNKYSDNYNDNYKDNYSDDYNDQYSHQYSHESTHRSPLMLIVGVMKILLCLLLLAWCCLRNCKGAVRCARYHCRRVLGRRRVIGEGNERGNTNDSNNGGNDRGGDGGNRGDANDSNVNDDSTHTTISVPILNPEDATRGSNIISTDDSPTRRNPDIISTDVSPTTAYARME